MRPNQVETAKLSKQASKDINSGPKRSKSIKSESAKIKKDGQTKSPTVKRPKEIQYSRLLFIQHYFNGSETKKASDNEKEEHVEPVIDEEDKADGAQNEEDKKDDDDKKQDESKPADESKAEGEDANQIDSSTVQRQEDETAVDERGEEAHECYDGESDHEQEVLPNPYENDEPLMLEINSKSKSKCLKKVILEK